MAFLLLLPYGASTSQSVEADSQGFGLEPSRTEGPAEHDTCVEELQRLSPAGSQERAGHEKL